METLIDHTVQISMLVGNAFSMDCISECLKIARQIPNDLRGENEALKSELKEALDVLLKVSPKHKSWVMKNWAYLYNVGAKNDSTK